MSKKRITSLDKNKGGLRKFGIRAQKSLGQNFLIDEVVSGTIINAADLKSTDTVVEVGPGLGVLTERLVCNAGKVIAIEIDSYLSKKLQKRLSQWQNLDIINSDILKLDINFLLKNYQEYKVVANIPYYITSPILHCFMQAKLKPSLMVVMMQEEVAQAIVAVPGKMSYLSVSMQIYSMPHIVCHVPAKSFYPMPKVNSAVVKFDMLPKPAVIVDDMTGFLQFIQCGFAAPRKQLHNSLSLGLKMATSDIIRSLEDAGINPQRRAESLSLNEWQMLYNSINSIVVRSNKPC